MSSSWLGSFAGKGYFQDLSSLVPTYPGLQWDDVVPVMQSNSSFGGKIYALPLTATSLSVYYRTDILGKRRRGAAEDLGRVPHDRQEVPGQGPQW